MIASMTMTNGPFVVEAEPGAAVRERISLHSARGIKRLSHPSRISRYHFFLWASDRRSSRAAARRVGAALSPRDTKGAGADAITVATLSSLPRTCGPGRGRPDDIEIVPRDRLARGAMSFVHELLFGFRIVNQQQIGVAPARGVQRLAGALRHDITDRDASCRELRKDTANRSRLRPTSSKPIQWTAPRPNGIRRAPAATIADMNRNFIIPRRSPRFAPVLPTRRPSR